MTPLPNNNTSRVAIQYVANGKTHVVNFRYDGVAPPTSPFLEELDDFLFACNPLMPTDWAFQAWSYTIEGTNVGVPMSGNPTAFDGTLTPNLADAPAFVTFTGRSIAGHQARVYLLGSGFDAHEGTETRKYRINAGENGDIDAALAAIGASSIVAIDNTVPLWKNYVNLGYNSYWQKKTRQG